MPDFLIVSISKKVFTCYLDFTGTNELGISLDDKNPTEEVKQVPFPRIVKIVNTMTQVPVSLKSPVAKKIAKHVKKFLQQARKKAESCTKED